MFTQGGPDEVRLDGLDHGTGPEHADIVALGDGDDAAWEVSDHSIVYGGPGDDIISLKSGEAQTTGVGRPGADEIRATVAIGGPGNDLLKANTVYARDGGGDFIQFGIDCYLDAGLEQVEFCQTVH